MQPLNHPAPSQKGNPKSTVCHAQAIGSLKAKGIEIQSIVCDGRYLTRNPQTAAGKELWRLVLSLKSSRRADFESSLKA